MPTSDGTFDLSWTGDPYIEAQIEYSKFWIFLLTSTRRLKKRFDWSLIKIPFSLAFYPSLGLGRFLERHGKSDKNIMGILGNDGYLSRQLITNNSFFSHFSCFFASIKNKSFYYFDSLRKIPQEWNDALQKLSWKFQSVEVRSPEKK